MIATGSLPAAGPGTSGTSGDRTGKGGGGFLAEAVEFPADVIRHALTLVFAVAGLGAMLALATSVWLVPGWAAATRAGLASAFAGVVETSATGSSTKGLQVPVRILSE